MIKTIEEIRNEMYLGERIETVLYTRISGPVGEYLKCKNGDYHLVRIFGVVYKVERNVEVDIDWYWQVTNMNTGSKIQLKDVYELGCLRELE